MAKQAASEKTPVGLRAKKANTIDSFLDNLPVRGDMTGDDCQGGVPTPEGVAEIHTLLRSIDTEIGVLIGKLSPLLFIHPRGDEACADKANPRCELFQDIIVKLRRQHEALEMLNNRLDL